MATAGISTEVPFGQYETPIEPTETPKLLDRFERINGRVTTFAARVTGVLKDLGWRVDLTSEQTDLQCQIGKWRHTTGQTAQRLGLQIEEQPNKGGENGGDLEALKDKFLNPSYLPSIDELKQAFPEEGPASGHQTSWQRFCENNQIWEFPTKEFIASFGTYLAGRLQELGASTAKPIIVLEVGAGNGRLSHFLREELRKQGLKEKVEIIATDDPGNDPRWKDIKAHFRVERLSYEKAVEKYNPTIVICSWMPSGEDWTPAFRRNENVKEYILIGEPDFGACGSIATWGMNEYDVERDEYIEGFIPEFERDGFVRVDLSPWGMEEGVITGQVCRIDWYPGDGRSATVSFRRKE